ncbi:hypothetical protein K456DRAFT_1551555 [Colletotrichum gloeosporioides 23]|nr:hypothetical protein K456DRAFT_1551555 [Colletotrichum gloeosporioides 23]
MRHGTLFNGRGCHWPPLDLASLCESSASIRTYNFGSLRCTGKYVFVEGGGSSEVQFHNARPRDRRCRRYEVVQASFPIDRPGCSPYAAHTHTQPEREAVRWDLLFHSKFNLPDRFSRCQQVFAAGPKNGGGKACRTGGWAGWPGAASSTAWDEMAGLHAKVRIPHGVVAGTLRADDAVRHTLGRVSYAVRSSPVLLIGTIGGGMVKGK